MYIFFQIIKYFCFQFESGPGPVAYMMVIDQAVGPMSHVTHLSAAWSIIITYMLLPERSFERRLFRDLFNQVF